jgi:hypothetical protein
MFARTKSTYANRNNQEGLHESICSDCLATVASVSNARELTSKEAAHVCSPVRMSQLTERWNAHAVESRRPQPPSRGNFVD